MFKAIHQNTHDEIIVLDPDWTNRLEELRQLDRAGLLTCQGCKRSVRLKAGQIRIRHFAHKELGACTYGKESPALLSTRAILYRYLRIAFGDAVTLEKQFENGECPRPVDCWVEREGAKPIAYWIVDTPMRPQMRSRLRCGIETTGAFIHWIFTAEMLRPFQDQENRFLLSTTERELAVKTVFDAEIIGTRIWHGKTLQYLDSKAGTLTTLRSLNCVHEPQVYQGRNLSHSLTDIVVAPKTGALAHPGERDRFLTIEQEWKRQDEERRSLEAKRRRDEEIERSTRLARHQGESASRALSVGVLIPAEIGLPAHTPPPEPLRQVVEDKEGICIHCGQRTRKWWLYRMGSCKCYNCLAKGLD